MSRLNEHTLRQSPTDPKGIYIALEPEQRLPTISVNRRGEAMFLADDGRTLKADDRLDIQAGRDAATRQYSTSDL